MKNEAQSNCLRNDSIYASPKLQRPFEHRSASERTASQPESSDRAKIRSSDASDTLPSSPKIPSIFNSKKYQVSDQLQPCCFADHTQHPKKISKLPPLTPRAQANLMHGRQIGHSKASISARTKDLRLKGADLYVARLGNDCKFSNLPAPLDPPQRSLSPAPPPKVRSQNSPKSLHDELRLSTPPALSNSSHDSATAASNTATTPQIRASRPCHRCITHMHAAGIARAFWTNSHGEWEGAKVRDLMDALERGSCRSGSGEGGDGKGNDAGIFVTKHEVLMLRRVMGC